MKAASSGYNLLRHHLEPGAPSLYGTCRYNVQYRGTVVGTAGTGQFPYKVLEPARRGGRCPAITSLPLGLEKAILLPSAAIWLGR
ncbi:hypothetical protein J6590_010048 [Homalodisca vitripennis]|nr:hypothetical protein J6590_010048 [Homalodisca vitripennis]